MARRGLFHYLRIQWRDGLFRFLLDAPTAVDLERVVVVPGPRVAFAQTDYNRHFTVREIVRDSERGFYNLVHASGLAHLEHYFRVMFFASRLEARFDAELLEGEAYEMRCRVAEITGPLVDVEVAFHSLRGGRDDKDAAAFRVVWRLMLVVDPRRKRMYDFERGEVTGGAAAVALPAVARRASSRGWTVTRRGRYVTSASVALVLVLVGAYALVPVGVRLVLPLPEMVADALADLSPREAVVAFAFLGVWLRTHPGRQPLHSSVDMLLPHG
jgi:acyl-CoA thioesterase FadM